MSKCANHIISAVRYNPEHTHIDKVKAHEVTGALIDEGVEFARRPIVDAINMGMVIATASKNDIGEWSIGGKVAVINVNGTDYLKTENTDTEDDNLGSLPEF